MEAGLDRRLAAALDRVCVEHGIRGDDLQVLCDRLRYEKPIERDAVVAAHLAVQARSASLNRGELAAERSKV